MQFSINPEKPQLLQEALLDRELQPCSQSSRNLRVPDNSPAASLMPGAARLLHSAPVSAALSVSGAGSGHCMQGYLLYNADDPLSLFPSSANIDSVDAVVQDMLSSHTASDPFALVKGELENVSERLRRSILTDIPVLGKAASYFFQVMLLFLAELNEPYHHHQLILIILIILLLIILIMASPRCGSTSSLNCGGQPAALLARVSFWCASM